MKYIALLVGLFMATTASAQQTTDATAGVVRVLDKVTGAVTDLQLSTGETAALGLLKVTLNECRYLTSNPNGDAFTKLTVLYRDLPTPVFEGWMIASAPALNAMEHPRYDVWALRCITS
tara:strand:+ start:87 stop:443 length:357 start_codon:yes stop_codon:yes gene_type:complete